MRLLTLEPCVNISPANTAPVPMMVHMCFESLLMPNGSILSPDFMIVYR